MNFLRLIRLLRFGLLAFTAGSALYLARRFTVVRIPGGDRGMEPTFRPGEALLVDRRPGTLARGDVVVFSQGNGSMRVGRIGALPGQFVDVLDGRLRVNGEGVLPVLGGASPPVGVVPDGEALVVRDNPDPGPKEGTVFERIREERLRGRIVIGWPF